MELFRNYNNELLMFVNFVIHGYAQKIGKYRSDGLFEIQRNLLLSKKYWKIISRNEYKNLKDFIINTVEYGLHENSDLTKQDAHNMAKHIEYEYRDYRRA